MGPEVSDGTKWLKNELMESPTKLMENEMKDCSNESVQMDCSCGGMALMAPMASMASMAPMATMASMAPMVVVVAVASMVAVVSLNRRSRLEPVVLVLKIGLRASVVVTEARRNTKGKGSLSMTCWDMFFLGKWLCSLTVMAPQVMFGSRLLGPAFSRKLVISRRW